MRRLTECPICDASEIRFNYRGQTTRSPLDPKHWDVYRCDVCDHGFISPQPEWSELADYYHEHYQAYGPSHGLVEDFGDIVHKARGCGEYRHVSISPGLRILDVGCGGGSFLTVARALEASVRGIEPSSFGAKTARGHGLDVFEGTLEGYIATAPTERYDLITFSHVIEHLANPITTLVHAASLLDTDGMIWFSIPNGACRSARVLKWRWHSTDLPLHLHHFSLKSAKIAVEKAGLSVRNLGTYSMPAAVRESMLLEMRYRWGIPRSLSKRLLPDQFAERHASKMDQKKVGEAILGEFVLASDHKYGDSFGGSL